MNYSLVTADRRTHIKIVVLSLVLGIGVVLAGIGTHLRDAPVSTSAVRAPTLVKAEKATLFTGRETTAIR